MVCRKAVLPTLCSIVQIGCFTDVVLHSSVNYHKEHATEPGRLPKDVPTVWSAVIL